MDKLKKLKIMVIKLLKKSNMLMKMELNIGALEN